MLYSSRWHLKLNKNLINKLHVHLLKFVRRILRARSTTAVQCESLLFNEQMHTVSMRPKRIRVFWVPTLNNNSDTAVIVFHIFNLTLSRTVYFRGRTKET